MQMRHQIGHRSRFPTPIAIDFWYPLWNMCEDHDRRSNFILWVLRHDNLYPATYSYPHNRRQTIRLFKIITQARNTTWTYECRFRQKGLDHRCRQFSLPDTRTRQFVGIPFLLPTPLPTDYRSMNWSCMTQMWDKTWLKIGRILWEISRKIQHLDIFISWYDSCKNGHSLQDR